LSEDPPLPVFTVTTVSGEELTVLTPVEQRWFTNSRDMYLTQTKFTETTDLRDLDRLLSQELMVFRMTQWLSASVDYNGFEVDETLLRRNLREYSEQITRLKSSMNLNKAARDDAANSGDLSVYISELKARGREFGIHRENQLTRALVLMNELSSIVGAFDRSDAEERDRLGFVDEKEIVEWIRTRMLPEYKEIDEHFRANSQKYWIRKM
jgi:hypothetical protein